MESTNALVWDRIDLLVEVEAIARELDRVECRTGPHELIDATRHRQENVRAGVIQQIRNLLGVGDSARLH